MRPSEQYGLTWDRVDLVRRFLTIPKSKNGGTRHVGLNSIAVAALTALKQRSLTERAIVLLICRESD
jgi:integrase